MIPSLSLFQCGALIALVVVQTVLAASSAPSASTVKSQALAAHNKYRTRHHVPELKWSVKLAEHARNVTTSCVYGLNRMEGTGQNIAYASSSSMEGIVDTWYKQVSNYTYGQSQPADGKSTNAFTQIVWKGTTEIGCAATFCSNLKATFYVCDYSPPGNIRGKYAENVVKP